MANEWLHPRRTLQPEDEDSPAPRRRLLIPLVPWLPRKRRAISIEEAEEPGVARSRTALNVLLYRTFRAAGRGLYRIFNAAEYRFYRSNVAPPVEGDVPFATSSSLPHEPVNAYADGTWYLSVSYFNGIMDSGFLPLGPRGETYLTLQVSAGVPLTDRPGLPTGVRLEVRAGGVIRVIAFYVATPDGAARASQWAIAYTVDGSTPATDTPTLTPKTAGGALSVLAYDLPAQVDGTTVKVRVQTRRAIAGPSYRYSDAGDVLTAVADAQGPQAPADLKSWSGALPEDS